MEVKLCGHNLLAPAYNSFGGKLLESIEKPQQTFSELPLIKKISAIGLRILLLFAYLGATVLDFVILLAMTITIIPAMRVGRAHLVNLICSLASLALGFGMLFGHNQKVDKGRKLHGKPISEDLNQSLTNLIQVEMYIETVRKKRRILNFNHLVPLLDWQSFRIMTPEKFHQISQLIEKAVQNGVDINSLIKMTPDDDTEFRLIHYLTVLLRSSNSYAELDGVYLLLETALRLGADPQKKTKFASINYNLIERILKQMGNMPNLVLLFRLMLKKGIKFDRPFEVDNTPGVKFNEDVISKNLLLYAATQSNVEVIALFIEGGASLNFTALEQTVLQKLYELSLSRPWLRGDRENIRLVKSLQTDAPVEERRWAAAMFLRYDCINTAMKLLNQHDIAPTLETDRINWSSELLIAAIDSGNINSINFVLGKYVLIWHEVADALIAQIDPYQPSTRLDHASGFEMLNAINLYKARVVESIYTIEALANLKAPIENIVAKLLF